MQEALIKELAQRAINADAEDGQVRWADLRLIVDKLFVCFAECKVWLPSPLCSGEFGSPSAVQAW